MMSAARFRFLSLGWAISRLTWARDLFAAHGQHRVAEGNQDPEQAEALGQISIFQKAQGFGAELEIRRESAAAAAEAPV